VVERQQEEGLGREGRLSARSGRAAAFSLGISVGFLVLGYAALRVIELAPRSGPPAMAAPDVPAEIADLGRWRARLEFEGTPIEARLAPLHDEPGLESFRARALRQRYGLPGGEPWRLYLTLLAEGREFVFEEASVTEDLVPFATRAQAPEKSDPLFTLLAARPRELVLGRARPLVLWGHLRAEAPELALVVRARDGEPQRLTAVLERDPDASEPRWYAGEALAEPELDLEAKVAFLEHELERERARRAEREAAFLEFSKLVAELPVAQEQGLVPRPEKTAPPPDPEALERAAAAEAARSRAAEIGRALGVRMRLEGLRGLDLLETGSLLSGSPSAIGPVVFRCLDERGALTGSLSAARLSLEGSQAAHTLTLVLQDGFESRGGERVPFTNGTRRITLKEVDPEPWRAEFPELFGEGLAAPGDDGRWPLGDLRRELNRLLGLEPSKGWYRLRSLGGVRGDALLDVQLEELQASGHLARRFFADTLTIQLEDGSVVLELEGGASVKGDEKQPFRDGRFRIVLPHATLEPWRATRLPGLSEPPTPAPAAGKQ
jgi:hypothetical protein